MSYHMNKYVHYHAMHINMYKFLICNILDTWIYQTIIGLINVLLTLYKKNQGINYVIDKTINSVHVR